MTEHDHTIEAFILILHYTRSNIETLKKFLLVDNDLSCLPCRHCANRSHEMVHKKFLIITYDIYFLLASKELMKNIIFLLSSLIYSIVHMHIKLQIKLILWQFMHFSKLNLAVFVSFFKVIVKNN